jgi:hypothetical protein
MVSEVKTILLHAGRVDTMKCIIIIRGLLYPNYMEVRKDLTAQFEEKGQPVPFFCQLPADYTDIEVVWIDKELEAEQYTQALRSQFNQLPLLSQQ